MIVAYLCVCKYKKHYNPRCIQEYQISEIHLCCYGIAKLFCFRNKHQDFPGHSVTFWKGSWKGDQIFRYRKVFIYNNEEEIAKIVLFYCSKI